MKQQTKLKLRGQKVEQKFFPREHIKDRHYINNIDKIVMIWKSKKEKLGLETEPYRIITLEQFKKEYKRFL